MGAATMPPTAGRPGRRKLAPRSAAIVQLAGQVGGTATGEAAAALGLRASIVASYLSMMVKSGRLFRARRHGHWPRYFSTEQAAQAYLVAASGCAAAPARGSGLLTSVVAPQPLLSGPAVCPPGHEPRHTVVPSPRHDPRYQVSPAERPFGAGFAAAGVGFDVTTGRPWQARSHVTAPGGQ